MKPCALVVEDDKAQALIFVQALETAGYEVTHVADGSEALAYLKEHTPYLTLLDLHLSGTAGADLLHFIRSDPRLTKSKVMLATADPRLADTLSGKSDLVLLKPISFIQLRDLARRLLPG